MVPLHTRVLRDDSVKPASECPIKGACKIQWFCDVDGEDVKAATALVSNIVQCNPDDMKLSLLNHEKSLVRMRIS